VDHVKHAVNASNATANSKRWGQYLIDKLQYAEQLIQGLDSERLGKEVALQQHVAEQTKKSLSDAQDTSLSNSPV